MNHSRVTLQPAYVLHQRPYRDTSSLIEVFTPSFGRVGIVAKGSRSAKSRMQGLLQPFQALLVSWSGRGELVTLTGCESGGPPRQLAGQVLVSGFYMSELLLRLLHRHDPHPVLFQAYSEALAALDQTNQQQRALRIFEKRLLQELGYALILDHQADTGEPLVADSVYNYELEKGPLPHDTLNEHELTLHGRSLMSLANEELNDTLSLRESKRLTRAALALYLGGKPLHSRKLLADLHKATHYKDPATDPARV
ncbi:MAG TPA: DNA repair protein RecO [Gammaproteobacteria bacterium]|nr:DNA repair protein RecO [Gammaproteobacteria bacterium]